MDKETVDYIQKNIDILNSLEKGKSESFMKWIRHIITILIGLLTVLIAFKSTKSINYFHHILFSTILSLIGTAIISGTIFLFHEIDEFKQELKFQKESLSKRLKGDFTSIFHREIKRKQIYKVCEFIFYGSSILSVLTLIVYGIILDR
jgi:dolichyl-phosphate-mannose--protein O-mannosyl transferase